MELLLKEWIISLTAIAVLGAMVEIMLPNSKFKKYTRFIFGLILLVILLKPILPILGGTNSLEDLIKTNFDRMEMSAYDLDVDNIGDIQKEQVINVYKANLEKEIVSRLQDKLDIKTEAHVTIVDYSEGGSITYNLVIERIDIIPDEEKIGIKPVKVSVSTSKDNGSEKDGMDSKTESKIKRELVNLLEISPDIIHIHSKD